MLDKPTDRRPKVGKAQRQAMADGKDNRKKQQIETVSLPSG
jgi:hypothetical protein